MDNNVIYFYFHPIVKSEDYPAYFNMLQEDSRIDKAGIAFPRKINTTSNLSRAGIVILQKNENAENVLHWLNSQVFIAKAEIPAPRYALA